MTRAALALVALVACLGCSDAAPGDPCTAHDDCDSLAEGYCARAEVCTRECRDDFPCPSASACVHAGGRDVCLHACTADSECPTGFACTRFEAASACALANPLAPPADD